MSEPKNSLDLAVNDLAEALDSLLLMFIVLVALVILIVCVECCGLVQWVVNGRSRNKKSSKKSHLSKNLKLAAVGDVAKDSSVSTKSRKICVRGQSRGRTPFKIASGQTSQKPISCSISSHKQPVKPLAVMDRSTSPGHPTTRAAESHNERSVKMHSGSARPSKETTSGSGRKSKETVIVPKKVNVEPEQLDGALKTQKVLSKEDHRDQMRDMLRARKLFLGELPVVSTKSLEELKPIVKVAEVRIDMPIDVQVETVKNQNGVKIGGLQMPEPLFPGHFVETQKLVDPASIKAVAPSNDVYQDASAVGKVASVKSSEVMNYAAGSQAPKAAVLPHEAKEKSQPEKDKGIESANSSSVSNFPDGSPV